MDSNLILVVSLLLLIGIFASKITIKFGAPVLLLFLGLGMLVGSDVLGLIYFDDAVLTQSVANISLVFILFGAGFCTHRDDMKASFGPSLTLATLGIVLTAGILGGLIILFTSITPIIAFLIGAIISSTDAAAVNSILLQTPVQKKVSSTLEIESAANDPMAIVLTLAILQIMTSGSADISVFLIKILWQLAGGIICGRFLGKAGSFLFDKLRSDNRGNYYVLCIAIPLLAYGLADAIHASGAIAVFFAGYWLGNSNFVYKNGAGSFIEGISSFANMGTFMLLGLLVFPLQLMSVWKEGVIVALLLIFIARPLAVLICMIPFKYNIREKIFIISGGIKGAVPIVLATYPAVYKVVEHNYIFNIVFFAVLLSCILQGMTLAKLAKALKILIKPKAKQLHSFELMSLEKGDIGLLEIQAAAEVSGRRIQEFCFPKQTLITSIIRNNKIISPNGDTEIIEDDILFILCLNEQRQRVGEMFGKEE